MKSKKVPIIDLGDDDDEDANEQAELIEELNTKIDDLFNCVERPVGSLKPRIAQTEASERAILALYDAIGRNI